MTPMEFFRELQNAASTEPLQKLRFADFKELTGRAGFPSAEKTTEVRLVSSDPARSAVERLTNGMDGVIDLEYQRHSGLPECRSPREAAVAWLGVPENEALVQ